MDPERWRYADFQNGGKNSGEGADKQYPEKGRAIALLMFGQFQTAVATAVGNGEQVAVELAFSASGAAAAQRRVSRAYRLLLRVH